MSRHFNALPSEINLTLTLFFVVYSIGTLVWGPLCDKYGRRPVLLVGLSVYVVASMLCATAWDVYALIAFRVLQAAGGSTAGTCATAIVKDVYAGRRREAVLALVQSMVLISPAAAPVLGAIMLQLTSWRGVFWVLAGIGVIALAGSLLFEETIPERSPVSVLRTFTRLGKVLENRRFTSLLVIFSLFSVASLAFITSSSYIYVDGFGLSERAYSYYFTLNALGLISGPMLYMRLSRHFSRGSIIIGCMATLVASGLLVAGLGQLQPWLFTITPPAGLDRRELPASARGQPDARTAGNRHRLCRVPDWERRPPVGQPGHRHHLFQLAQRHYDGGPAVCRPRRGLSRPVVLRDAADRPAARH